MGDGLWLSCSQSSPLGPPKDQLGHPGPHVLGQPPGVPTLGHQERGTGRGWSYSPCRVSHIWISGQRTHLLSWKISSSSAGWGLCVGNVGAHGTVQVWAQECSWGSRPDSLCLLGPQFPHLGTGLAGLKVPSGGHSSMVSLYNQSPLITTLMGEDRRPKHCYHCYNYRDPTLTTGRPDTRLRAKHYLVLTTTWRNRCMHSHYRQG